MGLVGAPTCAAIPAWEPFPLAWLLAGGADAAAILASGRAPGRRLPPRAGLAEEGGGRGFAGRGRGGGRRQLGGDQEEAEAEDGKEAGAGLEFGSLAGSWSLFIRWNSCRRAPGERAKWHGHPCWSSGLIVWTSSANSVGLLDESWVLWHRFGTWSPASMFRFCFFIIIGEYIQVFYLFILILLIFMLTNSILFGVKQ
jgi:hypothetical protein